MCVPPLAIEIEILDALRRVIKQGPKNKQTDLVIFGEKGLTFLKKAFENALRSKSTITRPVSNYPYYVLYVFIFL